MIFGVFVPFVGTVTPNLTGRVFSFFSMLCSDSTQFLTWCAESAFVFFPYEIRWRSCDTALQRCLSPRI